MTYSAYGLNSGQVVIDKPCSHNADIEMFYRIASAWQIGDCIGCTLGATVGWVQETQTVNARNATISISLQIGVKKGWVVRNNQQSSIDLEVEPQVVNGSTLVPVRFVSESLGAEVSWDSDTSTL